MGADINSSTVCPTRIFSFPDFNGPIDPSDRFFLQISIQNQEALTVGSLLRPALFIESGTQTPVAESCGGRSFFLSIVLS